MTLRETIDHVAERVRKWRKSPTCYVDLYVTLLKIHGLWQEEPPGRFANWGAHSLLISALYLSVVSCPIGMYRVRVHPFAVLLEPVGFFFIYLAIAVHYGRFLYRGRNMSTMIRGFKAMLALGAELPAQCPDLRRTTRRQCDLAMVHYLNKWPVAALTLTALLVHLCRQRELLFCGWYPFDEYASPAFELVLVFLTVVLFWGVIAVTLVFALIMTLLIETSCQLKTLRVNISLLCTEKQRQGNDRGAVRTMSDVAGDDLERGMRKCVKHHQAIIRFVRQFQSAFEVVLSQHFVTCTVPCLMAVVVATYSRELDAKVRMYLVIIFFCLLDLGIFCVLAERITTEVIIIPDPQNDLVRDAAFSSGWPESSNSFQRSLRIVMSAANKPLVVTLAGCIPLSVHQFHEVLKLTYSFYMSSVAMVERALGKHA